MFRDETQGDSKASESQTSSAFIKLDELQDKIKRNELTVLDLAQVRVKAEVKAVRELKEHNSVLALTVLPGGELASGSCRVGGSGDNTIKLWNVKTGECVRTLGHSGWVSTLTMMVSALTVLPGGELASGSGDEKIKLWNVKTGECVRTLSGHKSAVRTLTMLPGGELASGSQDGTIKLWNVKTGECVRTLSGHSGAVRTLTMLPGGELASGSHDETIKLWNVKTGECVRTLSGHGDSVYALTVLPGGELASGSSDKTIKLWNVKTGECVRTLSGHSRAVTALTMLPGGELASASSADTTIKLWNVKTGECVRTLGHSWVQALTVLPGGMLASGSNDNTIKLWNIAALQRQLSWSEVNTLITLLKKNRSLTRLTMRLTLDEMKAPEGKVIRSLVGLVSANKTLVQLDIQKTGMSEQGVRKLHEAVKQRKPALVIEHEAILKIQGKPAVLLEHSGVPKTQPKVVEPPSPLPSLVAASDEVKAAAPQNSITAVETNGAALNTLLQEFKSSGLSVTDLTQLQRTLATFPVDEVSASVQWIRQCQMQWKIIEARLTTVSEFVETSAEAKAAQAEIDQDPTLQAYQCRLQQELAKFITAYWLSTSDVFKLADNKKGKVLSAVKELPIAGSFLSIFVVGLETANDKYRFYQINRLANLFTDTDMIVQVCQCFSRHMTRAKAAEIKVQKAEERVGMKEKAVGFFQDVKKWVGEQLKEWKTTSDKTGIKLQPCEGLALLDGSFLLDQILQGKVSITKTSDPQTMANQFLQVVGVPAVPLSPTASPSPTALSDVAIRNALVTRTEADPALSVVPVAVSVSTQSASAEDSKKAQAALESKVQQLDQQLEQLSRSSGPGVDQEEVRRMRESMQALQGEIQRLQNLPQQMKDMKRQMDELSPGHSGGNQLLATRGQFAEGQALAVDSELQQHHGRLMMVEGEAAQQKESLQVIDDQLTSFQAKLSRLEKQQRDQTSVEALRERLEIQEKEMKKQQEEQLKAQQTQQAELERLKQELARQETNQSACGCVVL